LATGTEGGASGLTLGMAIVSDISLSCRFA
jgi:hypothetical protein